MKAWARIRRAFGRGMARADTWVAAAALVLTGYEVADGNWVVAVITGLIGMTFLVASGDYCWRRGYVIGRREATGTGTPDVPRPRGPRGGR